MDGERRSFQGVEVLAGELFRKNSALRVFMKNVRSQVPGDIARKREDSHYDFLLLHDSIASFKPTEGLSFTNLGRLIGFPLSLAHADFDQDLDHG